MAELEIDRHMGRRAPHTHSCASCEKLPSNEMAASDKPSRWSGRRDLAPCRR